jgi:hypothetical protein
LRHVRTVVTDPELRRQNQRHLADEIQHSRVGWAGCTSDDAARGSGASLENRGW